jgi:predicted metalloprotease
VDQDVYLDLSFFDELSQRFGAPGDFAAAYVIAHEVGHHVQNLMGIMEDLDAYREKATPEQYNRMSVRVELQADFLAGVWGYHARHSLDLLEAGDLEEALAAATAIGDDRLQKRAQGTIVPDAFTHGTSAQRVKWFRRGFETGDISAGDTFQVPYEEL